jgi:acyl-CoA thioesterase II
MHFDQYLELLSSSPADTSSVVTIKDDWTQGKTLYGGLSAALLYHSMKQHVADESREIRSFNCNFIGALLPDKEFTVQTSVLRQGKNVSQLMAQAVQNGQVMVMAQATFGVSRESKISVNNDNNHKMPWPTKANFIPQIPKITPRFLRHFDLVIQDGKMPFTSSSNSHYHGWMRFKQPPKQITDTHIVAMIDAWPPTVLQMLRWSAPASTMSWNLEFIHPHSPYQADDWFAYQCRTRQAAAGYAHTEANIWDAKGQLIALSRQAVAVFG